LPRLALYEAWGRLRRPAIERATGPIDLVHATAFPVPAARAPVVVTVHDLAFVHEPTHFSAHGVRFFNRHLDIALKEAALVLCPSRATMADCEAAGFEPARLRLVPLGVEGSPAGSEAVAAARARFGLPARYVLWTGTVEPRKNLANLLRAFARTDTDATLVLAGPKGWNEDLDALVAPVRARVKVLGFLQRGDLDALYAGAAAFCFPSLLEGFGLPVLEAMLQGAPVITSKGTATEELAGDAALLVDPRDPEAIAEALTAVLNDPDLARRLSAAGRARAAAFSWQRCAHAVIECYREAAGE
jgi:glycosyltransferase involved in cell wall biosynthesis